MSAFDAATAEHLRKLKAEVSAASAMPQDQVEAQADEIIEDLDDLLEEYPHGPTIDDLQEHYGVSAALARAALTHLRKKELIDTTFTDGVVRLVRLRAEPRPEPSPSRAAQASHTQPAKAALEPDPAPAVARDPDPVRDDAVTPAPARAVVASPRASPQASRRSGRSLNDRLLAHLHQRFGGVSEWEVPSAKELSDIVQAPTASILAAMLELRTRGDLICVARGTAKTQARYRWPSGAALGPTLIAKAVDPEPETPASPQTSWRGGKRPESRDQSLTRFGHAKIEPDRAIGLRPDHPALVQERTIFPSTVVSPWDSPALLVSGHNNAKLGGEIQKGPWAGMPQYHLTLEERATCPRSCAVWDRCMGNSMHMARRHDHRDPAFLTLLEAELWLKSREHPQGFAVRLHTLGDFYSLEYVRFWAHAVDTVPGLRAWGFTACLPNAEDPREREIGEAIAILTSAAWDHFAIRFSGHAGGQGAVVTDGPYQRDWLIMCPAQTEKTLACSTCGICWSEGAREKAIGFQIHGMKGAASHDG